MGEMKLVDHIFAKESGRKRGRKPCAHTAPTGWDYVPVCGDAGFYDGARRAAGAFGADPIIGVL